METLSTNISAQELCRRINSNADNDIVESTDSATKAASSLNTYFDEVIVDVGDSATEFVDALNTAFASITPTPMQRYFKFLHVSDTHSGNGAITEAAQMVAQDNNIEAICHTGDITANVAEMSGNYTAKGKVLAVQGNHDAADTFGKDKAVARTKMESINRNDVVWNEEQSGCYWHKDFVLSNQSKLRFIGIDQYNYTDSNTGVYLYSNVITQAQADWFVERLLELRPTDYVIVMLHEVPLPQTPPAASYRQSNLFCSSRLFTWDSNHENCKDLWARIVNAYITRTSINLTTSASGLQITVNEDFSGVNPAKFLFFLAGHTHGDFVGYHPSFGGVLILAIDTAQPTTQGRTSDLRTSDTPVEESGSRNPSNGILLNEVTIDFVDKTITIERIGHKQTVAHTILTKGSGIDINDSHDVGYTYPAVTRTSLTLNF